ncbi:hypothetical protein [Nostoc sp. CHAB 5715]|uniref:hypothetical protein n=1 Tax=Nostoc sp. CHAB 5715 TaxID=2780400 RepID=UPI001E4F48C5|nr:hypothetical protein [Nostoc sp. CHAB 5715]MCC5626296.1 hypothetical protein [Nostoc sp. CHAB 5715]
MGSGEYYYSLLSIAYYCFIHLNVGFSLFLNMAWSINYFPSLPHLPTPHSLLPTPQ